MRSRIFSIDLQLFAEGEKTEKATPKKRRDTREEGQVLQSREVTSAFILLLCFIGFKIFGGRIFSNYLEFLEEVFSLISNPTDIFLESNFKVGFLKVIVEFLGAILPIGLISLLSGLLINYAQIGFLFTTKPLKIKLSRINPIEGFKRLFSKRAIMELLKSIIKVVIIGYVAYNFISNNLNTIINLPGLEMIPAIKSMSSIILDFAMKIAGVLIALAFVDYFYQWREYEKNLMMTKEEIKEEYKQTEGNPQTKSKIRETQRRLARSRMMQEVPKADVIITNPTHLSVALKYDAEKYSAPYLIAKGADNIAFNIRKIGKENDIPIVENKILARTIYENVEIGETIPDDLYEAVAEVLAYVYSLKDKY
ncbi:flagellar biosynthesis protein FlhB [Sporanaerobacter sp. PP17-6a]|jgi:flagellar biosynthetic protein FlhB|uniref:flagellar biosynthesis protein FlhB n=1 Tax=Sporanaerobacter sp. PP17-6a TaxID=1891289 RepID=UPI00089FE8DB|nr:flagellar biosynthesis protein FlhB [Sporanaerobacter sp. PP17-6a]MBE6081742.1 flagellar biosynthesis protein FlhB [Tissierellaceae bacterium]SCL83046.1 Flagellar biosynthetic protein FlhB [Sporanaerobacter sp. PP17-6a]